MTPAERAQLQADLADALELREELNRQWAAASYTSSGTTTPERADVALARVNAAIASLEEAMAGAGGLAPATSVNLAAPPANDAPAAAGHHDDMLTTAEAAALLRVTVKGLERIRAQGNGPPFKRIGRAVRYRRGDLTGAK